MIQIRNLSKIYENSRGERAEVLKNIDLTIEDGDIYGIVGYPAREKARWCVVSICWNAPRRARCI